MFTFIHVQLQTFFGNMLVPSTDLLNLANPLPDQSFAIHLKVDKTLKVGTNVAVQCAILYASSRGLFFIIRFSHDLNDWKLEFACINTSAALLLAIIEFS